MNGIPLLERNNLITGFAFVLLMIIGVGFRVYGLESEMPWYDEIVSFDYDMEHGLNRFLKNMTVFNHPVSPLYFVIEFGWMKLFDDTPLTLRYLSILINIGTMTFLFLFARRLLGNTGGLLALSFMVCSQFQIFYAQEIRMYPLVLCTAALSCWAFQVHLHSKNNFWLMLNILANALLIWTHLHGALFIMAQGISYLLYQPRAVHRWLIWGLGNAPHGFVFFLWYITRNHTRMNADTNWINPATYDTYLQLFTWYHAILPHTWLSNEWGKNIILGSILVAIAGLVLALRKKEQRQSAHNMLAQCLPLLLVPILIIFVMDRFEEYMGISRYYIYASFITYLFLAWILIRIPFSILRYSAIAAILLLSFYEASSLERPLRTDWAQAQLQLEMREEKGDVFLLDRRISKFGFAYNLEPAPRDIRFIPEHEQRHAHFAQLMANGRRVWIFQSPSPDNILEFPENYEVLLDSLPMDGRPIIEISLVAPKQKANAPKRIHPQKYRSQTLSK